jgi:transposase-like protein
MEQASFHRIINVLPDLDKAQKVLLFQILHESMNPVQSTNKTISNLEEIRENRFKEGLKCIHCSSLSVRKFGKYRNRQRYQCRTCGGTFNDLTGTPFHRTQHLDKWSKYLEYMIEGYSIRKCAELVAISKNTSFAWRHKVLHALLRIPAAKLQGIVESDETYELFSNKGSRHMNREPRKRGGVATKRGISQEQVCILVARDRSKNTSCQVAGLGRIDSETLQKRIGPQIVPESIFCSDEEPVFRAFCRKAKLLQVRINSQEKNRVINGIYHIQNVNAFHSRYKLWEARFYGISTKYMDNYLAWFRFLDTTFHLENQKRVKQLLLDSTSHTMEVSGIDFSKYYESRLQAICA